MPTSIRKIANAVEDIYKTLNPPVLTHKFSISIEQVILATFAECSALSMETTTYEFVEGGTNETTTLPGPYKNGRVTLKRGIDLASDMWTWFEDFKTGNIKRTNLQIQVYGDIPFVTARSYNLEGAFPVKWTGAPLNAAGTGAVAIESLEIAFARFEVERVNLPIVGNVFNAASKVLKRKAP